MATATEPKNGLAPQPQRSLVAVMAAKYEIEQENFLSTIKATVIGPNASREELIAFLLVANKYDLNPLTKEIYAFPKKGGGIQPIVSVDGWANIINSHPDFDGMEFHDMLGEDMALLAITCKMYRKDRSHPIECTEYMAECKRGTDVWRQWPRRMLRHKAMIQASRYAFGLAGIMEPDEAERAESVGWSQQPQSKVGISDVNKMLDAMPAHKASGTPQDATEGTDDIPTDEGSQEPAETLEGFQELLDGCRVKADALKLRDAYVKRGMPEHVLLQIEASCAEKADTLPEVLPAGKAKQKSAFE